MKYSTSNEFPVKGNSRGGVRRNRKVNRQRIEFRALDSSSSSSLNGQNERQRHRNDSMNDNNDKNSPKSTSSNYLTKTGLKLNAGRNRKKSRIKLSMHTKLLVFNKASLIQGKSILSTHGCRLIVLQCV